MSRQLIVYHSVKETINEDYIIIVNQQQGSFPPVNTPNDCPIRCVTTPCPCGAYCSQQSCPVNCPVWKQDKRGCNTCDCECPLVKCSEPCPYGFKTDEFGCQTCQCRDCPLGDQPCSVVRCGSGTTPTVINKPNACPTCKCVANPKPGVCAPRIGFGICIAECTDDAECPGAQKCCGSCPRQCEDPLLKPACPLVLCAKPCPYGSLTDENGCQTCRCRGGFLS
ncbi:hypothetical protein EB796_002878 [Bugula neritina]|uniref:Antistasin-like domain-containing protein n=1 Tax=Bugula neritina TaxID=10212 RepID=A0A7J7KKK9_BUGNE|nr:hypothetical protein EB796_013311 [Bugula neritina]KAF6038817.1 hypothetical protein EB796_002878 [Bugula neritina]